MADPPRCSDTGDDTGVEPDRETITGTPRWVKVFGVIALVLVLLFFILLLTGRGHGPHVTSSVGWLGAVAGFLALAIAGLTSQDVQMVRAAYLTMELTGWFVLVPLALASLLTGLVQSLGTN